MNNLTPVILLPSLLLAGIVVVLVLARRRQTTGQGVPPTLTRIRIGVGLILLALMFFSTAIQTQPESGSDTQLTLRLPDTDPKEMAARWKQDSERQRAVSVQHHLFFVEQHGGSWVLATNLTMSVDVPSNGPPVKVERRFSHNGVDYTFEQNHHGVRYVGTVHRSSSQAGDEVQSDMFHLSGGSQYSYRSRNGSGSRGSNSYAYNLWEVLEPGYYTSRPHLLNLRVGSTYRNLKVLEYTTLSEGGATFKEVPAAEWLSQRMASQPFEMRIAYSGALPARSFLTYAVQSVDLALFMFLLAVWLVCPLVPLKHLKFTVALLACLLFWIGMDRALLARDAARLERAPYGTAAQATQIRQVSKTLFYKDTAKRYAEAALTLPEGRR